MASTHSPGGTPGTRASTDPPGSQIGIERNLYDVPALRMQVLDRRSWKEHLFDSKGFNTV